MENHEKINLKFNQLIKHMPAISAQAFRSECQQLAAMTGATEEQIKNKVLELANQPTTNQ